LLTHSYAPEHSPPQRRWTQLIRSFRAADWQVDVVTPIAHAPYGRRILPSKLAGRPFMVTPGEFGERILRVPFLWHRTTRIGRLLSHLFSAACSVPAAMMIARPDVVIVTVPSLPIIGAGYVVARLLKRPLVVDMRDAWPDLARDARIVQGSAKSIVERAIIAIQDRADLVVTVTHGFAQTLRDRGLKNVATVSNGVDISTLRHLSAPSAEQDRLEVLYLGNHGESQRLDVVIRAAALVGDRMRLTMVGHGVERRNLIELAEKLGAPVDFHASVHGSPILDFYEHADTCIVSLRDDWKSFETTIPSKTYEVLSVGRHVTGIVLGEAKVILEQARAGHVVRAHPQDIAELWNRLADDRSLLQIGQYGREWVENNADVEALGRTYIELLEQVVGGPAR
jgi:glycosyltransferase involved in cell wall biosynthesis